MKFQVVIASRPACPLIELERAAERTNIEHQANELEARLNRMASFKMEVRQVLGPVSFFILKGH